jgi:hypothetical protein
MAPGCLLAGPAAAPETKTQIQVEFSGMPLASLAGLSAVEMFALVGAIEVCPCCGGKGCAVHLGFTGGR